ncbi:hypothetical protein M407DRAFT_24209 [Tulasnella calospora MUT 4182]|uniref:F-box domain-containing protein n=1 Tax=Tulasnella calospora MUT 4182 TaxID=1051891 RepID=A0A0C3KYN6_9AGAM|nr:hypothetical protein M407DRAFT_24209 [Tulasnella calospora MUT 4182]
MRTLYAIRLIAKRWQEIVDGTPAFWKFVMPTLPPHVNEAAISRSASGPLAIMYGNKNGPVVSGYLDKPAAHLRKIVLGQGISCIPVLDLLGGNATNHRPVDLSDVSIPWKTGLFARLKVLKLRFDLDPKHKLTTTHLLDALWASPGLEHLGIDFLRVTIDYPASLPVITYPHLRYIDFDYCNDEFAGAILHQSEHCPAPTSPCTCHQSASRTNLPIFLNEYFGPLQYLFRTIYSRNGSSEITPGGAFERRSPADLLRVHISWWYCHTLHFLG